MWTKEKAELVEQYLDQSEEIQEYLIVEDGQEYIVYLKKNIDFFGRHHLVRAVLLADGWSINVAERVLRIYFRMPDEVVD